MRFSAMLSASTSSDWGLEMGLTSVAIAMNFAFLQRWERGYLYFKKSRRKKGLMMGQPPDQQGLF